MQLRVSSMAALLLFAPGMVAAQHPHPALLPAPQTVLYGDGSISVAQLCVSSRPTDADATFALDTLFAGLAVREHSCGSHGIRLQLKWNAHGSPLPLPGETSGPDAREAYSLEIARGAVTIQGNSSAAIFYGVQTLLQMEEGKSLPLASVHDWPALAYRGTLMDAGSEGPMLRLEEVKKQLDLIARYKGNQYFFYSEGNIELTGYPLLNPNARFTQNQVRDIIAYARQRHIDVVPAVEMYAHLHDLFRIEQYSDLADFPHGTQFDPTNPKVKAILQDWAAQISALFPSPFVDIGFDETWSLQKASAKDGINTTPVKLFLQQLDAVTALFQSRGKSVMAYADIMVKFPGIIPHLPNGLIALPWWYDPIDEAQYHHWLAPLAEEHVPHIVTSGVTSWDQITPDFATTFANIDKWLVAGQRSHTLGLLNTLWTDDGQALLQMSWPGIAYGAAAAWQHQPMQPQGFIPQYSALQYPATVAPGMSIALQELALAETALQQAIGTETMLQMWRDPFRPESLLQTSQHAADLRKARLHAEAALTQLYAIRDAAPATEGLDSLIAGAQTIDLVGLKFLSANEIDAAWKSLPKKPTREQLLEVLAQSISNETHSRCMDLMDGFSETRAAYKRAWQMQYTDYRLGTALGRWDTEFQFWLHAQTSFELLRTTFKTGDSLPTLQDLTHSSY